MGPFKSYREYFRSIAIANSKIRHNPASEDLNSELIGEKAFDTFNTEQVLKDNDKGLNRDRCCLHLHVFNADISSPGHTTGVFNGGFMITRVSDNETPIDSCYEECESIVLAIIKKMQQDYSGQSNAHCSPFGIMDFEKISYSAVGPIWNNRYGWYVMFNYKNQSLEEYAQNLADNQFNGI